MEYAPGATHHVAFTNAFHAVNVNSLPVRSTTVFMDSATSIRMVNTDSRISQHALRRSDCHVSIQASCGASSAVKKGNINFGIQNAQDKRMPRASEVLLVRDRGKIRVVEHGSHETDTGEDKAAPVASQEAVHLLFAHVATRALLLRQADVRTTFLHARNTSPAKAACVILQKCSSLRQTSKAGVEN